MQPEPLSRDLFREGTFARDGRICVTCGMTGQDAHHIMERRLFPDGGYYLDNGATLCQMCHLFAESTELSCETIREKAGIKNIILPPHLYPDQRYDKWGNPILPNGMRLRGELFEDESVQKVLKPMLHLFTNRVKYPRTWHLPWSPGATDDDRILPWEVLHEWGRSGREVVITEKMDGENTTMYSDGLHARSLDYEPHPSRDRIKAMWAILATSIPENWRICGENLTAVHSIRYDALPSFFMPFSMWDGLTCLSWDDTVTYAKALDLTPVPVLWRGYWLEDNYEKIRTEAWINAQIHRPGGVEGYVVRPAASFHMKDFSKLVGKYVRHNHIQTHGHWMRQKVEYNGLA